MQQEDPFIRVVEYWNILRQHKKAIVLLTVLGFLVGISYNVLQIPMYEAKATMEIQGSQDGLSGISFVASRDPSIQTQVDILKSRTLLQNVVSKMAPPKEPMGQPDFLAPWRERLGLLPSSEKDAWSDAVFTARTSYVVSSTRESRIIVLRCDSTDPRVAAEFVNKVAEGYIDQRVKERWDAYQVTSKWLNQAQSELKEKLELAENELQEFARSSGLLFTSETQNVSEDKLKQLQSALAEAQATRIAKEAQYEASRSSKPEALPEVLDSGPIGTYQVQLTELRRQLAELSSALTPEHYKIKRLQAQIGELESVLTTERSNIIKRIRNEYDAALRTENQIRAEYDRQVRTISGEAENLIHYRILKREAETSRQLYELTLQKGKEASIASALRASDARIIDRANPPRRPHRPSLPINILAGLGFGVLSGCAFSVVRERLRATIHLTGNAALPLNVRELGIIPSASVDRLSPGRIRQALSSAAGNHRYGALPLQLNSTGDIELITWKQKPSIMAEAFRATMASILFSSDDHTGRPQAIVFTSPSPGEGKTTILCNVAIALSEINRRVLIIDGDMRIPRLHNIFGLINRWGLSNLLSETSPVESYPMSSLTCETEIPGLFILPSGSARANFSSLLYSARLPMLLARCRQEFAAVLIDAPPVLRVPDARILGRAADSIILVFRADRTTRDDALEAARFFEEDGTPILGSILNDFNPGNAGYGRYRSKYSGYYGYYGSGGSSSAGPHSR